MVKDEPSSQLENSKLEKMGRANALPSPALAGKPHSAQVWFLERQRPLSFASRIALSRFSLLPGAPRLGWGLPSYPQSTSTARPTRREGCGESQITPSP